MPIPDDIAAVRAQADLSEDEKRHRVYAIKTAALIDVILNGKPALLGRTITHQEFQFCINSAQATPEHSLALDVTFTRPPAEPITHQITIVNPPVLPHERSGNEKQDLIAAIHEMLEGFV